MGVGNRKSFEEKLNLVVFKFNFEGTWLDLELCRARGWMIHVGPFKLRIFGAKYVKY